MVTHTGAYEFAHGHKPRGRGLWIFEVTLQRLHKFRTETVQVTGTFAAARAEAVREAKRLNPGSQTTAVAVNVLP